jgi:hypothetical protein
MAAVMARHSSSRPISGGELLPIRPAGLRWTGPIRLYRSRY